jgi:beta-galactosidase GanA
MTSCKIRTRELLLSIASTARLRNPPLKWSEIGPVEKVPQAASKPDFPDTTIAYLRWYWNALEPERGKYRWDIVDLSLQEARTHGQTLAIRLMPYSNQDPLPSWYAVHRCAAG